MRLLIVQRIFSNYRKVVFDKLANIYDLRLVHAKNLSGINQAIAKYSIKVSAWQFSKRETNQFLWLFFDLFKFKPKVVIHEMALGMPTLFLILRLRKLIGFKFILWGHGYDRKKGFSPTQQRGDRIRLYLMKKSDAVILYDLDTKKLLSKYLDENKLFVAPNTLDTELLKSIRIKLEKQGRLRVRKELLWTKKYNLVYIGRLLPSKHPDKLFEIINQLPNEFQREVAIHFIGSGSEEEKLKMQAEKMSKEIAVYFYGAIHDLHESGKMLYAADLMIIPGAVGLSVNHAYAFGCPLATFGKTKNNGPFHGPEITYVVHKQTGIIIPILIANLWLII